MADVPERPGSVSPSQGTSVTIDTSQQREDALQRLPSGQGTADVPTTVPERDSDETDPSHTNPQGVADATMREQADGPGEMLNQESGEQGPSRGSESTPRGRPAGERQNLQPLYRQRGEARLRALTDLFGQDALVLGHLLFQVPPLAIRINKGNITYRWKPLRTKESIAVKSGNGECAIEIDLAFVGLSQIQNSLSELIALWKKVPFCFVENVHIRRMMIPDKPDESMALCLESLVMDAVSGTPDTVYATLLTRWFNYKPFSSNFYFRKDWQPVGNSASRPAPDGNSSLTSSTARTEEGTADSPEQTHQSDAVLLDLSSMQDHTVIESLCQGMPPEVGLLESQQADNPGDPSIRGTYPVVYPFNSKPFLARVRQGDPRPVRIDGWGDGITMRWNKFIRMQVPRGWQYTRDNNSTTDSSASPTTRDRGTEGNPAPVQGERDIILFLGDSNMVAYLSVVGRDDTKSPTSGGLSYDQASLFEFSGSTTFPGTSGFTYMAMVRDGATTAALANWWNAKKNDPSLRKENSDQSCDRVAGVVLNSGIFDGPTGPDIGAMRTILSEASGFGAIPILITLPPVGDATHVVPAANSELKLRLGESQFAAYISSLPDYHNSMSNLVGSVSNAMLIDPHSVLVEDRFRENRGAPLNPEYHDDSVYAEGLGQSGYYDIVWNSAGRSRGGVFIHGQLPWNQLSGDEPAPTRETWTVCHVEDGDTVWVWGNHPETNERVVRNIRMKYVDTPETYHEYSNSAYTGLSYTGTIAVTGTAPNMQVQIEGADIPDWAIGGRVTISGIVAIGSNGTFTITGRPSSDTITYSNPRGVTVTYTGTIVIGVGSSPLPEGQDSYRPEEAKYGKIAKDALAAQLPVGSQVEVEWLGTGEYGRYLAVLYKEDRNLNYWMIEQGYGFVMVEDDASEAEDSVDYLFADRVARGEEGTGGPRGIYAQVEQTLTGLPTGFDETITTRLQNLMRPEDWRRDFRAGGSGGHGGTPAACTQGNLDSSDPPAEVGDA